MILLIQYTLLFASVLMLVALGGCFSEHSGVINLGLEGIMVMGALGGALVMKYLPAGTSAFVIVLLVILASMLMGLIYSTLLGVAGINFSADQTLVGTAMNMLAAALATVIVKSINVAENPDNVSSTVQYVQAKKALIVNVAGFQFNWFMLVAVILLFASHFILYKTRFGLRLMACGEHPAAADSVGISVAKMRWAGVLISRVEVRDRRRRLRFPGSGGYDLRPVEAPEHRGRSPAVRFLPRTFQCLQRLPLPGGSEDPGLHLQHDALPDLPGRPGTHLQEFQSSQSGRYPVRQEQKVICVTGTYLLTHF